MLIIVCLNAGGDTVSVQRRGVGVRSAGSSQYPRQEAGVLPGNAAGNI